MDCRDLVLAKELQRGRAAVAYAHWRRHELIKAFVLWREETREAIITSRVGPGCAAKQCALYCKSPVGYLWNTVLRVSAYLGHDIAIHNFFLPEVLTVQQGDSGC